MWSTIILCNFQSCCCYFRFRSLHSVGYNYQLLVYYFLDEKTFFTWNQVDPALWNGVFPDFFFLTKTKLNQNGWFITFWMKKHFLREIRLILLYEMGFSRIFFLTNTKLNQNGWLSRFGMKQKFNGIRMDLYQNFFSEKRSKTKMIGNSTPCTELRCWNAM